MNNIKTYILGSAALFVAAPAFADAPSDSATLNVSAVVSDNCHVSTTPVDFGSIDVTLGSASGATGGVTVQCTNGTPFTVLADKGASGTATLASREMQSGSNRLKYSLFLDAGYEQLWGDDSETSSQFGGEATGNPQAFSVYGRIEANQQTVPAGNYSDDVTVTVTY